MERLLLWGDSPVRWLTTAIFHTAATIAIGLTATTFSSMQMGHREPGRRSRGMEERGNRRDKGERGKRAREIEKTEKQKQTEEKRYKGKGQEIRRKSLGQKVKKMHQ